VWALRERRREFLEQTETVELAEQRAVKREGVPREEQEEFCSRVGALVAPIEEGAA